jgi:hypothetical protein
MHHESYFPQRRANSPLSRRRVIRLVVGFVYRLLSRTFRLPIALTHVSFIRFVYRLLSRTFRLPIALAHV